MMSKLELPEQEVHLWMMPLLPQYGADADGTIQFGAPPGALVNLLDSAEKARLQALPERLQSRFVLTRATLRTVLSRYEPSIGPPDWSFTRNAAGRPEIPGSVRFNISHAGDLLVFAFARQQPGVDVERLDRRVRHLALAKRFFTATEYQALEALPADQQPDRFLALWTLKEAWVKARGTGLANAMQSCAFGFPGPGRIDWILTRPEKSEPWRFWQLDADGYRIALALQGGGESVRLRHFEFSAGVEREVGREVHSCN